MSDPAAWTADGIAGLALIVSAVALWRGKRRQSREEDAVGRWAQPTRPVML